VIRHLAKCAAGGVVGGLACAAVFGLLAAYEDEATKREVRHRFDQRAALADVQAARSNAVRGGWVR
jgi:hypothetical protein